MNFYSSLFAKMMTANTRKLATFRQLSLNSELPEPPRQQRKVLRKQFSEDIPDLTEKLLDASIGIKVSFAAKTLRKNPDQPPPIKVAWADDNDNAVIVTKCKENVRPHSILSRRYSIEKDSILHSKQDLGARLHDKTPEKTNINIYLGHNSERSEEVSSKNRINAYDQCQRPAVPEKPEYSPRPKIISPLIVPESCNGGKNMFQIRKNPRHRTNNELPYTPSHKIGDRSSSVVVVPVIEQCKAEDENRQANSKTNTNVDSETDRKGNCFSDSEDNIDENEDSPKPVNVLIKPISSAMKRERFQKRTNSAFNSTVRDNIFRPPLTRSSSAPSKPDGKSKFLATKRKIKPASKKEKNKTSPKLTNTENLNTNEKDGGKVKLKELNRYVSVNAGEVETMVSLVSPEESDAEDITEPEKKLAVTPNGSAVKPKQALPVKNPPIRTEDIDAQRSTSLRKIVKSVSFQQSSIHAIRSFSASFPSRRASMAAGLALGAATGSTFRSTAAQEKNMNEKRNSISSEDERGPKRRLVRSKTEDCPPSSSYLSQDDDPEDCEEKISREIKIDLGVKTTCKDDDVAKDIDSISKDAADEAHKDDEGKEEPFENPKEKQCWDMYCKMTQKGINVSYDTILRGMLTPTEYRMRKKKDTLAIEDENC